MTKAQQLKQSPKKPRTRKCLTCRQWFKPKSPGVTTCSDECAIAYGISNFKKQATREKAKAKKVHYDNDKSKLMQDCQKIANKIGKVHAYLSGVKTCATCPIVLSTQQQIDGGHCFPTSTYSGIRFYTLQIRPQCVKCNRYNSGMRVEFENALIGLYGESKIEWLRTFKGKPTKYTVEYLKRYKTTMGKRLKKLEQRLILI